MLVFWSAGLTVVPAIGASPNGRPDLTIEAVVTGGPPLTRLVHSVVAPDGSIYVADARTAGILHYGVDGRFIREIGRAGKGPGELRRPWRVGLLADTLWVVDEGNRRVSLFSATTGLSIGDRRYDAPTAGFSVVPLALLEGGNVLYVTASVDDPRVVQVVLARRTVAELDRSDSYLQLTDGSGDGAVQLWNPYAWSDIVTTDPYGRGFMIVRRPVSRADTTSFYAVEAYNEKGMTVFRGRVRYRPQRMTDEIDLWLRGHPAVDVAIRSGLFASENDAIRQARSQLATTSFMPPIDNFGQGVVTATVVIAADGRPWIQRSPARWDVLMASGSERVQVAGPPKVRLLGVARDHAWGFTYDGLGVPTLVKLRIRE